MFYRKDAVLLAVASLLASSGFAMADTTDLKVPELSLDPSVIQAQAAPDQAPLMWALDKIGAAKPLTSLGINIYGWSESGYTYNHRNFGGNHPIEPGPFNEEFGNHYMMNQLDLRIERQVDSKKFDVGGLVEFLYGTDANITHSTGINFYGADPSTSNEAFAASQRTSVNYGLDLLQAYVDVNVPVGNGLKFRVGKFVTLLGYETIDPRGNNFYSHSYIFNSLPFTNTGILGIYQFNDQWAVTAGISRGWDQSLEDSGPRGGTGAIDSIGQVTYTPNKQWTVYLNWSVGPEDFGDTSHYRTAIDPIVTWQVTDAFKLAAEALYVYDGGLNGDALGTGVTHAYGDVWGADIYASYTLNDYVTANGRFEGYHTSAQTGASQSVGPTGPSGNTLNESTCVYSATLGVTVVPLPKDPLGKNLSIRPEIRYDWSSDPVFHAGNGEWRDQLTFAADVILKF